MPNRSLDDFGGDADSSDTSDADSSDTSDAEGDDGSPPGVGRDDEDGDVDGADSTVTPSLATYRFDPSGAPCDGCGERVSRRWEQDGTFVCADCKQW